MYILTKYTFRIFKKKKMENLCACKCNECLRGNCKDFSCVNCKSQYCEK